MSEPFLGEIRIFGFDFPPRGWAFCDGQILPISQNQSLYSLLGTTYGGNGRTDFALPDMRGRTPMHRGDNNQLGSKGGEETHALSIAEIPGHDHKVFATSTVATAPVPNGNQLADSAPNEIYRAAGSGAALNAATIGSAGGGQGHDNMQPWLALRFCIALQGLFPSRN